MECPDLPWDGEAEGGLPAPFTEPPFPSAVAYLDFLNSKGVGSGRILDLGCGKGRNAVFFARNHFEVHALDKSDGMLEGLHLHGIKPHSHDASDSLFFEDSFFEAAMDIFCYESISEKRKGMYRSELARVLKKGGFYLLSASKSYPKEKAENEFSDFRILKSFADESSHSFIMQLE